MSINSIANAAAARRPDIGPSPSAPRGLEEIAIAASTTPASTPTTAPHTAQPTSGSSVDTAFNVLFGYIPTEVLTLYVAVLAAIKPTTPQTNTVPDALWIAFFCFLLCTPVVVWLAYGAKMIVAKKKIPFEFRKWPVWEMFAATIAYCAWAFALPNSPFSDFGTWYSPGLAGVVVLIASTILGLLAPFFQRPLGDDSTS